MRDEWRPQPRNQRPPAPPTAEQRARRLHRAKLLCQNSGDDPTAWKIANRLALAWECGGCSGLGYPEPERCK